MSGVNYRDAGVDIDAGHKAVSLMKAAVERTHGPRVLGGLGAFGGLFDASFMKDMEAPLLVSSADGVGTKTKVAVAVNRYDTVGQDIVNHCVNDILVQGAEPLFFLDYVAASKLDPIMVSDLVKGAAKACEENGCALLGGETAEMPGVYEQGEFDLAGTIIGVVDRPNLVTGERMEQGDIVVALPSVGLHTNGFSLARKIFEDRDLGAPCPELDGQILSDVLLVPHRSYLPEYRKLKAADVDIRGMVHITGGGLVENPPRVLSDELGFDFDLGSFAFPPVFALMQELGQVDTMEMLRVFNCGVGMLFVIPADHKDAALAALGDEAWILGTVTARGEAPVIFQGA